MDLVFIELGRQHSTDMHNPELAGNPNLSFEENSHPLPTLMFPSTGHTLFLRQQAFG
jgi:hypothetical protein